MARKKLLSEGEIRQFMKLANLRPVGQTRLNEFGPEMEEMEEEEEIVDEPALDEPALDEPVADEMAPDAMAGDDAPADIELTDQDVADLVQAWDELGPLMDKLRAEVEAEGAEEGMEDMEGMDDDPMPDPAMDAAGPEIDEDPPGTRYDEGEIVAEVTRRVLSRVRNEKKAADRKDELAEQLAERIMKRLTK
jgi:hypothetical protein